MKENVVVSKVMTGLVAMGLGVGLYLTVDGQRMGDEVSEAERLGFLMDRQDVGAMENILREEPTLVNAVMGNTTPLMQAVLGEKAGMVRFLLQHGADANRPGVHGWTALHFAAMCRDPAIAEMLLAAGADAAARNEQGETALMVAVRYGNMRVVRVIMGGKRFV